MDFLTFVETRTVVLLDGAVGTQLAARGLSGSGQNNLTHPDAVLEIQQEYARCGCDALITNTLTMNRVYVETHNVGVDVHEVNRAGVELARQAASEGQYVLGNLSSTGQLLEPYGTYAESTVYDAFREQAEVLAEGGVDGFIVETMFDLREALCALRACRDAASLPVLVSLAFATLANGGRTIMGNSTEECARAVTEAGAHAVGANCGELDPVEMAEVVARLRGATSLPILAEPNAGKPRWIDGEVAHDMVPATFAAGVLKCLEAGACLVGGCCGTTPEHIRAVADMLER